MSTVTYCYIDIISITSEAHILLVLLRIIHKLSTSEIRAITNMLWIVDQWDPYYLY